MTIQREEEVRQADTEMENQTECQPDSGMSVHVQTVREKEARQHRYTNMEEHKENIKGRDAKKLKRTW